MEYNIIPKPKKISYREGVCAIALAPVETCLCEGFAREGYRVEIEPERVSVFASTEAGLFYAGITLDALCKNHGAVPCGVIEDEPLYPFRGFMLDVARHFFCVETVKKLIDALAALKLNVFHWHLADDQGFRLQIDKYPRLHEVASARAETRGDGKPVCGYYTKDEVREVVAYARARHIEVVPELDMPGHFSAIAAAYPELACTGEAGSVATYFGILPTLACAGRESTYDFIFSILDEVFELFPSAYLHLGGDEAVKLRWLECPYCQKKMAEFGLKNEEELQSYFMTRVVKYCQDAGKTVLNWNDGMLGGGLPQSMVVQYWKESKTCREACIREVNNGMSVVLSPFFSFYLDYPHRMTPLRKAYAFDEHMEGIKDPARVLGLSAPLWTEYVCDESRLYKQTFPRLAAVAELAWTPREGRNYKCFLSRLPAFFDRLQSAGVEYTNIRTADPRGFCGVLELLRFFKNAVRVNAKAGLAVKRAYKKAMRDKLERISS